MEDGDPTIDQCYPTATFEDVQHLSDTGYEAEFDLKIFVNFSFC